jgi:N-acetylglutamate synthase-like GNAT family acetyltransferase
MKGSNIRRAEVRDAETIRHLYQTSIRGLGLSDYSPEQIERWINRPVEAFEQDIQNTLVLLCEFQDHLIGFGQLDAKTAEIRAVYVHPDHARQNIGTFLLMLLEAKTDCADVPRFTVNAPLNAVAFFCAREFTELGPASIPLADGTGLPGVKMEYQEYQKLEFANDQSITDRVLTCLHCDHPRSRSKALQALKAQTPREVLDALMSLLHHPEEQIRRKVGSALNLFSKLNEEPVNVAQKADELAHYLEHGDDPRLRLRCALLLGPVHLPGVDSAFLQALADPCDMVVQWSCHEAAQRCGTEGIAKVMGLLNHSSWRVRLTACIALIQQKTADQRVVATLEALMREPEATEHDAFEDEFKELRKNLGLACGGDESELEGLGKMASILEKTREIANQVGSDGKAK